MQQSTRQPHRTSSRSSSSAAPRSIFVVGGAEIFKDAFGRADLRYIYLTRIDGHFETEVRIPNLDELGFTKTEWDGEQAAEEAGVRYRIERLAKSA
jgi:dihydrofolate reductase